MLVHEKFVLNRPGMDVHHLSPVGRISSMGPASVTGKGSLPGKAGCRAAGVIGRKLQRHLVVMAKIHTWVNKLTSNILITLSSNLSAVNAIVILLNMLLLSGLDCPQNVGRERRGGCRENTTHNFVVAIYIRLVETF